METGSDLGSEPTAGELINLPLDFERAHVSGRSLPSIAMLPMTDRWAHAARRLSSAICTARTRYLGTQGVLAAAVDGRGS